MHLFQLGYFMLNSGKHTCWKIECDALTDADWTTLAVMVRWLVGDISGVVGVPSGGLKLAQKIHDYATDAGLFIPSAPYLIVGDVLTTGGSMECLRQSCGKDNVIGAVVFSRGKLPTWIRCLFQAPLFASFTMNRG